MMMLSGKFLKGIIRFLQPILIANIIRYFKGEISITSALIYSASICVSILIYSLVGHAKFQLFQTEGMKMRLGCIGLLYKKVKIFLISFFLSSLLKILMNPKKKLLRINLNDEKNKSLRGTIVNIITNDARSIERCFVFCHSLIMGPLTVIASIAFLAYQLSFEGVLALPLIVVVLLLNILIGRLCIQFK